MKRRIIAALTALVMVVTMIPASAFAAGNTADDLAAIVKIVLNDDTVEYENRAKVEEAYSIYKALGKDHELGATEEARLLGAINAFGEFDRTVKALNDSMDKVTPASVKVDSSKVVSQDLRDALNAYNTLVAGVSAVDGSSVKVVKPAKETDFAALLGDDYKAVSSLAADGNIAGLDSVGSNIGAYFVAINNFASVTDKEIAKITGVDGTGKIEGSDSINTLWQAVKTLDDMSDVAENRENYLYLSYGYDRYLAVADKVAEFTDANKKEAELTTELNKAGDLTAINKMDSTALAAFKKALEDSKAYIASNKNATETFVDLYDAKQELYDKFMTKEDVTKAVLQLPSAAAIAKMTSAEVVKLYNETFSKIDEDVVAITTVKATYDAVKKAISDRVAAFGDAKAIAREYVAKFIAAVSEISAVPTRADMDKVDAAIEVVREYNALMTIAGKGEMQIAGNFVDDSLFSSAKDIEDAKDVTAIISTAIDGTVFKTMLVEVEKDCASFNKLVAAQAHIKSLLSADYTTIENVVLNISDADGTIKDAYTTVTADNVEAAQKAVDKYKAEYAKLSDVLKADFAELVANKKAPFETAEENLKDLEKAIAMVATDADKIAAEVVISAIKSFNSWYAIDGENIALGNRFYLLAVEKINAIEAGMADPAVKALVEADENYTTYKANKDAVEALAATGVAPTAVIKAIDALVVIDDETVITKELVDNSINAYEAVVKSYNALTTKEKAAVKNYSKVAKVEDGIKTIALPKLFKAEVAKIGTLTNNIPLSDEQKATINGITLMKDQYKEYYDFAAKGGTDYTTYTTALNKLNAEVTDAAQKEFEVIESLFVNVKANYLSKDAAGNVYYVVNKLSARAIVEVVDKFNALSDEAKAYALADPATATDKKGANINVVYFFGELQYAYKYAKAMILDYATVEVADQEYTGEELTPVVVVKDANGNVISDKDYTVAYSANVNPGTATVIVTATETGNVIGTVQGTFKITIDEPVKAEITGVKTDFGVVRVYFDRNEEVNGEDVMFQVQYKKSTSDKWLTKYPTKGYEYLTLRGLAKNGKYDVRVRAYYNVDGQKVYGEYSDVKSVYANKIGTRSSVMYKAVIKSLTTKNGSVTMTVNPVKYTSVPDGVTWKLSYKKYGSQYTTWTTKTTKSTTVTFKNLKKGTRYVFRAQYSYAPTFDKNVVNSNYSVYKNIVVK